MVDHVWEGGAEGKALPSFLTWRVLRRGEKGGGNISPSPRNFRQGIKKESYKLPVAVVRGGVHSWGGHVGSGKDIKNGERQYCKIRIPNNGK